MKKTVSIILSLVMLLCISACSAQPEQVATTAASSDSEAVTCTISIDCSTIAAKAENLPAGKDAFVPESGFIVKEKVVEIKSGETAFDLLKRICAENTCSESCTYCQKSGIHLDYEYTAAYGSYYIKGIHQLYEQDCGELSGWYFCLNGEMAPVAASSYEIREGDKIVFAYTCNMGEDLF